MAKKNDFLPIEDYFIIGDLRTAALVSNQGSIDWLCLPYFDSPSLFGRLLDPSGGCLSIDMPDFTIEAEYIKDTAMVEFNLSQADVELSIKDFMVPHASKSEINQQLVRTVSSRRGDATVVFKFQPKLNNGVFTPTLHKDKNQFKFSVGDGAVILHLPLGAEAANKNDIYKISVPIKAGQTSHLVLEYVPKLHKSSINRSDLEAETEKFWQQWIRKGHFSDFCRSYLVRSAITLKLMQFYPTGALVAAPTTSLPEEIGGVRNWDYRYSWIRDATFALYAFYVLGYNEEAEHFFSFIEKITEQCAEQDFEVSLIYTIWGESVPTERFLDHLSGYKNSKPVRTGNNAVQQFQLDVYGSLIDAFYFVTKHGLIDVDKNKWRKLVMQIVDKIDKTWQKPDHGIWEARVGTRHYTYSKVMAWVGADRASRLKEILSLSEEDLNLCQQLSTSIKQWVWQNSYKKELENFTQHPKTKAIDATNLLFILLQFLDKHEPLTRKIMNNTVRELNHDQVFVYRYLKPDGLPGKEGAFVLCSFWLISALAILEEVKPALNLFKCLEKYVNPQGLLAEEIDPMSKEYLGNYPQAFSHMGYIMSVHYISKYAKRHDIELA